MKILRISLRNIASLAGDHTVDFTKAPLANAGLFSISGPTGSGKSSLLDALCLALYSDTPRMATVQGAAPVADHGKEVQQRDVRNLLRRNCGEGYAEAAFTGVDGKDYTARWKLWRAHSKPGGALQAVQHTLFKGNIPPGSEGEVCAGGRAGEVREAIEAKVGLSFDQFRRAVLLAQGDFATFLKAKDGERAEILQALTGTERFQQISRAVYERAKSEETRVEEVSLRLGSSMPLSAEERAEAEQGLKAAEIFETSLLERLGQRRVQEKWFADEAALRDALSKSSLLVRQCEAEVVSCRELERELAWVQLASIEAGPVRAEELGLQRELSSASRQHAEMGNRIAGLRQELAILGERLAVARAAQEAALNHQKASAEPLARARSLDGELAPLAGAAKLAERECRSAEEVFAKTEKALQGLAASLELLGNRKLELQNELNGLQCFGTFARDVEFWLEKFKSEATARSKGDLAQDAAVGAAEVGAKSAALHAGVLAKLPSLRERVREAQAAHAAAAKEAERFDASQILTGRRRATDLVEALKEVRQKLDLQKRLSEEKAAHETALGETAAQLEQKTSRLRVLRESEVPLAQAGVNDARDGLRLAEAAVSEQALVLRLSLRSGEACPVCGSIEHPNAGGEHSPAAAALSALRGLLKEKEIRLQQLMAESAGTEGLVMEMRKQAAWREVELARRKAGLEEIGGYIPSGAEAARVWGLGGEQRESALRKHLEEAAVSVKKFDEEDSKRIVAERKAKVLSADLETAQEALRIAERGEAEAKGAAERDALACENARRDLGAAEGEHAAALGALAPVREALAAAGRVLNGSEGAEPLRQARRCFEEGARQWLEAEKLLGETRQSEAGKLEQLPSLQLALETARNELGLRVKNRTDAAAVWNEKMTARAGIFGGRPVNECEAELGAAVEQASAAVHKCVEEFGKAESELNADLGRAAELESRVSRLGGDFEKVDAVMEGWLRAFAEREGVAPSRADVDGWLGRGAAWVEAAQEEVKKKAQNLANALGAESLARGQHEGQVSRRPTEDPLETVVADVARLSADAEAAAKICDLKRAVIVNDDERTRRAGEFKEELLLRQKQAHPWQKLNSLIGSADGTKFRNIAQQWTLDILLKHANAQLQSLAGRYRLERLRDSLNLMVIDREMDGEQRSVHSLSGGESFLVSLGLALGLASLTSSRLLIESLFIDEGFGSLDTDTLRVALNALSQLESQGRKVGVISHVGELVDAIPVQVRVVRSGWGASKIVV
jgi:exonuclease SbcC